MKLAELLTTTVLLGILGTACAALVHAQSQLLRNVSDRTSGSEAMRTANGIVAAELRTTTAADLHGFAPDSIALRAYRGWGIVTLVADEIAIDYTGLRQPEAEKDSLLVVGSERTAAFTVVGADPLTIRTDLGLERGAIVLFFETGSYHLSTNALRYRRGLEGRQPVTDELLDHRASRFGLEANGRMLRVGLRARRSGVYGAQTTTTRIRLMNRSP